MSLNPVTLTLTSPHAFFTRVGGVSDGIYASLNCGYGSGDAQDKVTENRTRAAKHIGIAPTHLITCFQTHSAIVQTVTAPWTPDQAPQADAMVTTTPGIGLGILTADCAPILFEDVQAGIIGAAHAGWKGAFGGVLENTIAAMEVLGAKRERIRAAVGPCMAQPSFEVGPEFVAQFLDKDPNYAGFFTPATPSDKARFDLPEFIKANLQRANIAQIHWSGHDTYSDEARFFSYRRTTKRNEDVYGRQISIITLK